MSLFRKKRGRQNISTMFKGSAEHINTIDILPRFLGVGRNIGSKQKLMSMSVGDLSLSHSAGGPRTTSEGDGDEDDVGAAGERLDQAAAANSAMRELSVEPQTGLIAQLPKLRVLVSSPYASRTSSQVSDDENDVTLTDFAQGQSSSSLNLVGENIDDEVFDVDTLIEEHNKNEKRYAVALNVPSTSVQGSEKQISKVVGAMSMQDLRSSGQNSTKDLQVDLADGSNTKQKRVELSRSHEAMHMCTAPDHVSMSVNYPQKTLRPDDAAARGGLPAMGAGCVATPRQQQQQQRTCSSSSAHVDSDVTSGRPAAAARQRPASSIIEGRHWLAGFTDDWDYTTGNEAERRASFGSNREFMKDKLQRLTIR